MGTRVLSGGLPLTIPTPGTRPWDELFETLLQAIVDHDHTSGKGTQIVQSAMALTWSNWTPTLTAVAGSIGTVTVDYARYIQQGKLVTFAFMAHGTQASANTTGIRFSLPVVAAASTVGFSTFHGAYSIGGALQTGQGLIQAIGLGEICGADRGASVITTGAGRYVGGSGVYEAA